MGQKRIPAFLTALILAMFSAGCSCMPESEASSLVSSVPVSTDSSVSISMQSGVSSAVSSVETSSEPISQTVSSEPEASSEPDIPAVSSESESMAASVSSEPRSSQEISSQAASSEPTGPVQRVYSPDVPDIREIVYGTDVRTGEGASVDCSNLSEGFIIVKYGGSGTGGRLKAQVIKNGGSTYNFDLAPDKNEILPLTQGSGTYTVNVVENIGGNSYAVMYSCTVYAELRDDLLPFLYSNQFVDFASAPVTRAKAEELVQGLSTDVEVTSAIFDYVTKTLTYDYELAATVKSGYIPVLDSVMAVKKGICFDYASLMAGMLRYNRIPCKLVIGYAGDVYHAWIDVWLDGKGWIGGLIFYDGNGWEMMDPTFVSAYLDNPKLNSLYSKGVSYTQKYQY